MLNPRLAILQGDAFLPDRFYDHSILEDLAGFHDMQIVVLRKNGECAFLLLLFFFPSNKTKVMKLRKLRRNRLPMHRQCRIRIVILATAGWTRLIVQTRYLKDITGSRKGHLPLRSRGGQKIELHMRSPAAAREGVDAAAGPLTFANGTRTGASAVNQFQASTPTQSVPSTATAIILFRSVTITRIALTALMPLPVHSANMWQS